VANAKFDIPDWLKSKESSTSSPELPPIIVQNEDKLAAPPVGDIPVIVEPLDTNIKSTDRPLLLYEGWRPLHYR